MSSNPPSQPSGSASHLVSNTSDYTPGTTSNPASHPVRHRLPKTRNHKPNDSPHGDDPSSVYTGDPATTRPGYTAYGYYTMAAASYYRDPHYASYASPYPVNPYENPLPSRRPTYEEARDHESSWYSPRFRLSEHPHPHRPFYDVSGASGAFHAGDTSNERDGHVKIPSPGISGHGDSTARQDVWEQPSSASEPPFGSGNLQSGNTNTDEGRGGYAGYGEPYHRVPQNPFTSGLGHRVQNNTGSETFKCCSRHESASASGSDCHSYSDKRSRALRRVKGAIRNRSVRYVMPWEPEPGDEDGDEDEDESAFESASASLHVGDPFLARKAHPPLAPVSSSQPREARKAWYEMELNHWQQFGTGSSALPSGHGDHPEPSNGEAPSSCFDSDFRMEDRGSRDCRDGGGNDSDTDSDSTAVPSGFPRQTGPGEAGEGEESYSEAMIYWDEDMLFGPPVYDDADDADDDDDDDEWEDDDDLEDSSSDSDSGDSEESDVISVLRREGRAERSRTSNAVNSLNDSTDEGEADDEESTRNGGSTASDETSGTLAEYETDLETFDLTNKVPSMPNTSTSPKSTSLLNPTFTSLLSLPPSAFVTHPLITNILSKLTPAETISLLTDPDKLNLPLPSFPTWLEIRQTTNYTLCVHCPDGPESMPPAVKALNYYMSKTCMPPASTEVREEEVDNVSEMQKMDSSALVAMLQGVLAEMGTDEIYRVVVEPRVEGSDAEAEAEGGFTELVEAELPRKRSDGYDEKRETKALKSAGEGGLGRCKYFPLN
ncbi:hypothetical protein BJY04DRAFT_216322 [Aspergillus karnatakaensis]|uniref:uncharacterized protein n=1 Tax=Aspergillus karnatakaensis TaxID=1810916 RepID=UPI003CCDAC50